MLVAIEHCLIEIAAVAFSSSSSSSSSSVWEPKRAQRQRFASSIALIRSSVRTESSVLVSPNMDCRVLRVAGHSSSQCSRVWLSWKHFGHFGSVVGSIRWRYAASCMLCPALSLANITASLLLVSVFSSLAVEWLAYTAAVLAWEGDLSFRVRLITALAAFRLVGWASSSSYVASLANLSASSFPGMSMWSGTHWMSMCRSMASSRRHKEATSGLSLSRAAVRDWESLQISTLSCSSSLFFSSHLIALSMASFSSS